MADTHPMHNKIPVNCQPITEKRTGLQVMILNKLCIEKAKCIAFALAIGIVVHNVIHFNNSGMDSTC